MTPDYETLNPTPTEEFADGQVESLDAETNGDETQSGVVQPQAPQYLSREDLQAYLAERDAQWEQRLAQVQREAQVKADKARDNAVRKANAFETEYAEPLAAAGVEMTPDQIKAAKREIIDRNFWTNAPEPTAPPTMQYQPAPQQPQVATRESIATFLQVQGVDPSRINIDKYVGRTSDDPVYAPQFWQEIRNAQSPVTNSTQAPSQAANVVRQFGNTAPPSAVGSTPADPEKEYNRLAALPDPNDYEGGIMAYQRRLAKLELDLKRQKKW